MWDSRPSISSDGIGNFIISWQDYRNVNVDIYAQLYSSDGVAQGSNFRVTNTGEGLQGNPDVKLKNNRIYTTWEDTRTSGTGTDIWANVLDWDNPVGISGEDRPQILSDFILHQNYPNPFNPSTTIEFHLPKTSNVTFKIYNILGEEVATLVSDRLTAGSYNYDWDAGRLASGVYLYRLETGDFVETRKMVLMR